MNKTSVLKGATDAKAQAKMRKENVIVRSNEPKHKPSKKNLPPRDFAYGVMNRPSTPIEGVISNEYGQFAEISADAKYRDSLQKPEKLTKKPVRPTKASEKLLEHQKSKNSPDKSEKAETFKIKRFTKVESRVKAQLTKDKKTKENEAPQEEAKQ